MWLAAKPSPLDQIAQVAQARRRLLLGVYRRQLPMVIAGLRLDTSHAGTDEGPNSAQDGPRWRLLSHIPSWAQWSVRHPPGL